MKKTCINDTEIYPNYLLIGFRDKATGKVWSVEAFGPDERLSKEDRNWLREFMRRNRIIGFNLNGFDLLIIYGAIAGLTVRELRELRDDIIVGGMKSWEAEDEYGITVPRNLDFIDLIEVAPGKASLKIYNGRMHGKRMQDLPYDPNLRLSDEEIENVYSYWKNDLAATELLHKNLKTQLDLRTAMGKQYGLELRSKSDAQLAEAVIKKQVEKLLGQRVKKPELHGGMKFRYRAPSYIKFRNPDLNRILDMIEDWDFRISLGGKVLMPDFLSEAEIRIGDSIYRLGIGGLHSSEKNRKLLADNGYLLFDVDVASYYPNIILNLGLYPKHLGKAFLKVYRAIVERRLKAKAAAKALQKEIDDLEARIKQANGPSELMEERLAELKAEWQVENVANEGGKIMINGSFGKLGSPYSVLCSHDLMLTVTLTGQLSLLMLIEWLEDEGISVASGNTDGIVVRPHESQLELMREIIADWQKATSFEMEETPYKAMYQSSVNSYFALKAGGGTKRKGLYAKSGLEAKVNPANDICSEAVAQFLEHGTPISETIRKCRDIRQFVTVRTVNGGAIYGVREVEFERISEKTGKVLKPGVKFDASGAEYLGKAVRYYRSTQSLGALHYKTNLNRVPQSDGCRPLMELPDEFPSDVDFAAYVRDARQILQDIGYHDDLIGKPIKKKKAA
ncbi:hypothetical protein [Ochrobactrum sp. BTU2]|uniref:hypothetical protein n=1 Tax=Ochrobactrum sp. BTU2 TaxID=2856166 RepID=UPI00211A2376|nr:hypothetical protein [Ochrobactrum sp. BTU2]MCQ9146116.1 hypothetical protein [Ochrobactrum sp. BTU2]